ncbi:MAG: hypothetical protein WDN75_11775 [Bacteroidota bacterium]
MNEADSPNQGLEYYKLFAPLAGAILSIIGGFAALYFRARLDKKQEINYIKIGLTDELREICSIIGKLNETHNTTHTLPNLYLNDLKRNTESFSFHKQKLFLISSSELRREIVAFYKSLDEIISESINRVGTLGENPAGGTHDQIIAKFAALKLKAEALDVKLKKYEYYLLWYNPIK